MKRYLQSVWVWIDGIIISLVVFVLISGSIAPFYSALIAVAAGLLSAAVIAWSFALQNNKFEPIVEKYTKNNVVISEPVKVVGIKGQRVSLPARLVLTTDGAVMILLQSEGYRFTRDEDHSFIYIAKEKRMLLAKNGCDVQLCSGKMLNNLGMISLAIANKGFRIERRDHAPY